MKKQRKRKKNADKKQVKSYPRLSLTKRFFFYVALLAFAIVFTQTLQSKASNLFFWFVLLIPVVMLIYALSAGGAIRAYSTEEYTRVEKLEDVTYDFRIINEFILPYPFVEAVVLLPQKNCVRCSERMMKVSMFPLSSYTVKNTVKFRFRGNYDIGVECLYVYDPFRFFRVRVDVDSIMEVTVLPRKLLLEDSDGDAVSDSAEKTQRSPYTFDRLEVSDIRDYRPGDGLKSIHWKLSLKSEELVVKDYNTGVSRMTYIFSDLSGRYPDEEPAGDCELREEKLKSADTNASKAGRKAKKTGSAKIGNGCKSPNKASGEDMRSTVKAAARSVALGNRAEDQNANIRDISDDALEEYLENKEVRAEALGKIATAERRRHRKSKRAMKAALENKENDENADNSKKQADATLNSDGFGVSLLEFNSQSTFNAERPDSKLAHVLADERYYEDMNEYCADGVIELTVAVVLRELRNGNACCLVWFDDRAMAGAFGYVLESVEDFLSMFDRFVTAPICPKENSVTELSAMIQDSQSIKQIFVTASMDTETMRDFCEMSNLNDASSYGSSEIMLCCTDERFAFPKERRLYLEGCRDELSAKGLSLAEYKAENKSMRRI